MRKNLLLAIAFSLGIWVYVLILAAAPRNGSAALPSVQGPEDGMTAFFSPSGGCTDAIVSEINKANLSIDILAYTFTSPEIGQAVAAAYERGVKIRVILDKRQRTDKRSQALFLHNHHVQVFIDDQHTIAHNKVVLIDGKVLITGSFNFTVDSEDHNAENILVVHDRPKLIGAYQANFEHHLSHSLPFAPAVREPAVR